MLDFSLKTDAKGQRYIETSIAGKALLTIPQLNKGTAFSEIEREIFNLKGKLPNKIETLEDQVSRAYLQYKSFDLEINRNIYLNNLLNSNEVLFYRLIQDHLEEMLPTIYTPIVGSAVQTFNEKFMHPRGLYISYEDRHCIAEILDNRSNPSIDLIVVSDGEGVLGIGDQGIGGMAIPVAKLMVHTAIGGINPRRTLPIMLDAGTNNEALLNNPLYLGWRHKRLSGDEYAEFIDKFVKAIQEKFPCIFLHWEDFGRTNAYRNLTNYRNTTCSFNDDIQGTGVVTLAATLAALKITNTNLSEQRILVFGAGAAGIGVTNMLYKTLVHDGLSETDATKCFWLVDKSGLLTEYSADVTPAQHAYLRKKEEIDQWKIENPKQISLLETIENIKPTILIGTSACRSAFDHTIVTTMAKYVEHPIIFPLSNPTEHSEATPADLIKWTNGRAIIATGSPFDDVVFNGKTFPVSQCNNYLAFPGVGLGVIAVKAKQVTDEMLLSASQTLSQYADESTHRVLPTISQAHEASRQIALAVAKTAIESGLSDTLISDEKSLEALIDKHIWKPHYLPYQRTDKRC